jgi:hypothetical protein
MTSLVYDDDDLYKNDSSLYEDDESLYYDEDIQRAIKLSLNEENINDLLFNFDILSIKKEEKPNDNFIVGFNPINRQKQCDDEISIYSISDSEIEDWEDHHLLKDSVKNYSENKKSLNDWQKDKSILLSSNNNVDKKIPSDNPSEYEILNLINTGFLEDLDEMRMYALINKINTKKNHEKLLNEYKRIKNIVDNKQKLQKNLNKKKIYPIEALNYEKKMSKLYPSGGGFKDDWVIRNNNSIST